MRPQAFSQIPIDEQEPERHHQATNSQKGKKSINGDSPFNKFLVISIILNAVLLGIVFWQIAELKSDFNHNIEEANQNKIEKQHLNNAEQSIVKSENVPTSNESESKNSILEATLRTMAKNLKDLNAKIEKLNKEIQEKNENIQKLQKQTEDQLNQNKKLKQSLTKNEEIIKQLKAKVENETKNNKQLKEIIEKQNLKESENKIKLQEKSKAVNLYNESELALKKKLDQERQKYSASNNNNFPGIQLLKYNHRLNSTEAAKSAQKTSEDLLLINDDRIALHTKDNELPFCLIVPNYVDFPLFYYQYTFNSIFRQEYSSFMTVIFNSPDKKVNQFIQRYLKINGIPQSRYVFVQSRSNKTATENIYAAVHYYCAEDSIAMVIEGGNELLGKYTLAIYNAEFRKAPFGVIFSNYFEFKHKQFVRYGSTLGINEAQVKEKKFRNTPRNRFQLLAFRSELFRLIKLTDLQSSDGQYFQTSLTSIAIPLFELSCGRVSKIGGVYYVENMNQKYEIVVERQKMVYNMIAKRNVYSCDEDFNLKMNHFKRYSQQLEDISAAKYVQKGGMIDTPKGTVSLIDIFAKNGQNQRIDDIICVSQDRKKNRIDFHKMRMNFIKDKTNFTSLQLIKYNLKYDNSLDELQKVQQAKAYDQLDKQYHFDAYKQELPFCIIVPSLNNNVQSRIQYNLNSLFTQNYTNYFVIIINDASTDGSDGTYRKYLNFYNISKDRYAYVQNKKRKTALENIHDATYNFCSNDSVSMIVDGDDELIGKNTIKVFNAAYQKLKGGVIWSSYYMYSVNRRLQIGISRDYTKQQKIDISFRKADIKYCQLRTHKTALLKSIDKSVYQNEKGQFYKVTYDFSTYIPMMERACGRVYYIGGFYYLYNGMTGNNDGWVNYSGQIDVVYKVRAKPKLDCLPEYKNIPLYD